MPLIRARRWGVVLPVALLLLCLPLCVTVLVRQAALHRLQGVVARYEAGEAGSEALRRAIARASACGGTCPAETGLVVAVAEADLAREDPAAIPAARRTIAAVLTQRPQWGSALAVSAAIEARAGARRRAVALLARSYVAAPYLRSQAIWRLRFAAAAWGALDERTRVAVIEEAGWMARIGGIDRQVAAAALGDTPAGIRFALLMAERDAQPTAPER